MGQDLMGSLLGPVLANLFMGYPEKKWLQEFDKGKILMYKRYVDDIFCMFENEKDAENFCHFLMFLSKMKETVFQHQFIERKRQLGCLHSLTVLHQ